MSDPLVDRASLAPIADIVGRSGASLSLVVRHHEQESSFQVRLDSVARQIHSATAGAIAVDHQGPDDSPDSPALTIRAAGRDVIHYQAIPEGPEETPFLGALSALAAASANRPAADDLRRIERDTRIVVFIAPGCPNCPHGVRAAIALAVANPRITVTVVDAVQFAQRASRFNVRSVPTTVVDGELTLVGVKSQQELARRILETQGPGAERAVFSSLVECGRISDASAHLVDGKATEVFADLWSSSSLEGRIALTLAAQQALAENRRALDDIVQQLLPGLHADDPARRGDTADLLGEIGHADARADLEELCSDADPDVAEAAADALDGLELRAAGSGQGGA